jgi:hypothetical protein
MRTPIPRQVTDYAASIGVMTLLLIGALSLCAAPMVVGAALVR